MIFFFYLIFFTKYFQSVFSSFFGSGLLTSKCKQYSQVSGTKSSFTIIALNFLKDLCTSPGFTTYFNIKVFYEVFQCFFVLEVLILILLMMNCLNCLNQVLNFQVVCVGNSCNLNLVFLYMFLTVLKLNYLFFVLLKHYFFFLMKMAS